MSGVFWGGALIGLMFLNLLLGLAMGASAGAFSSALIYVGIDDKFVKEHTATMPPGSSSLFVLLRNPSAAPDKILEELKRTSGTILKKSLFHEDEAKIQAALNG